MPEGILVNDVARNYRVRISYGANEISYFYVETLINTNDIYNNNGWEPVFYAINGLFGVDGYLIHKEVKEWPSDVIYMFFDDMKYARW